MAAGSCLAFQHSKQGCQRAVISLSAWPFGRTLLVGSGYAASRLWACFGHALSKVDLAAGSACPCLLGQALAPRNESSECKAEDEELALHLLNTVFDGVRTEYLGIYMQVPRQWVGATRVRSPGSQQNNRDRAKHKYFVQNIRQAQDPLHEAAVGRRRS